MLMLKKLDVCEVGDGIARISVYDFAEMIEFSGQMGVALNLEKIMGAIILGSDKGIKEGDEVKTTGKFLSVPWRCLDWACR